MYTNHSFAESCNEIYKPFKDAQVDSVYADLPDENIDGMIKPNSTTIENQFINLAIDLFMKGTTPDSAILNKEDRAYVGVGLLANEVILPSHRQMELVINSIRYKDLRAKDNFGFEAFVCFYVLCNTEREEEVVKKEIEEYLFKNRIPLKKPAYQYAKMHMEKDEEYNRIVRTNGISTAIDSEISISYLRQNGNFLIQLEEYKHKWLTQEERFSRFFYNWRTITVYILHDNKAPAYNVNFKKYDYSVPEYMPSH